MAGIWELPSRMSARIGGPVTSGLSCRCSYSYLLAVSLTLSVSHHSSPFPVQLLVVQGVKESSLLSRVSSADHSPPARRVTPMVSHAFPQLAATYERVTWAAVVTRCIWRFEG